VPHSKKESGARPPKLLDFTPQQAEIIRKGVLGRDRLTQAKPYGQDLNIQPPLRVLHVEKQVGERYVASGEDCSKALHS